MAFLAGVPPMGPMGPPHLLIMNNPGLYRPVGVALPLASVASSINVPGAGNIPSGKLQTTNAFGFVPEQITEFKLLMKMALSHYVLKCRLYGLTSLESGSFGKIYRCTYNGTGVAVKEIGQSSNGQSNIKAKMRELLLELRVLVHALMKRNIPSVRV